MSATNVLAFPTQIETACDSCHRVVHADDLSTFDCCEARVCRNCHECDCDRLAVEMAERLAQLRPELLKRLAKGARRLAHAVRGKLAA
jgi:hypothetical protein